MTDAASTSNPMTGTAAAPPPPRRTPLTAVHEELGATLTDFAGWLMPLRYGSESAEHAAVRGAAGLFDLSHMGEITVTGPGAADALDYALVGRLSALKPGRARYTMIVDEDGGVLDDLVVYRLDDDEFLVVANAANAETVGGLLAARAFGRDATVTDRGDDYALIALQGPRAAAILGPLTDARLEEIKYYAGYPATVAGAAVLLARTGYTGEDGFEVFARPADAAGIWAALSAAGAGHGLVPAGLAARDTLRLEAGMALYGNELGPDVTPFDAGLDRLVRLDKPGDFVGRAALAARAGAARAGAWSGWPGRPGGCPGTGTRCCGTARRPGRSPAAPRRRRWAGRSPWPTSARRSRTRRRRRRARLARTAGPDGWRWTSEAARSLPDWCRCRSTGARPRPRDTIAHRASQPPANRSFRQKS
jgi:aminomethyltransferase